MVLKVAQMDTPPNGYKSPNLTALNVIKISEGKRARCRSCYRTEDSSDTGRHPEDESEEENSKTNSKV